MTLWIILTALTSAAAVVLAIPLIRRFDTPKSGQELVLAMSRDQLSEIEADVARGDLGEQEAAEAKAEIERRALAALKGDVATFAAPSDRMRLTAVMIVTGWIVIGAIGLYATIGRPDLSSTKRGAVGVATAQSPSRTAQKTELPMPSGGDASAPGSVEEMIASLVTRLEQAPDDAEGWRMLGWSYFNTERYAQAAEAYAKSVELDPSDPDVWSAYGEVLVRSARGLVSHDAIAAFDAALERNPDDPRARFFKGMALEQAGDAQAALDAWIDLARSAPPGADWVGGVITRIEELAAASSIDLGDRIAGLGGERQPEQTQAGQELAGNLLPPSGEPVRGPTKADVEAASDMSAEDRTAMIEGMVAKLAARLEDNPDDPEGWARLIRSRMIMGDASGARSALDTATSVFAGMPEKLAIVMASARESGLPVN